MFLDQVVGVEAGREIDHAIQVPIRAGGHPNPVLDPLAVALHLNGPLGAQVEPPLDPLAPPPPPLPGPVGGPLPGTLLGALLVVFAVFHCLSLPPLSRRGVNGSRRGQGVLAIHVFINGREAWRVPVAAEARSALAMARPIGQISLVDSSPADSVEQLMSALSDRGVSLHQYLAQLRWPEGFKCPHCSVSAATRIRRDAWRCSHCRREASLTTGTILHGSHLPLRKWVTAMWLMTALPGISQQNYAARLGVSTRIAWSLMRRIRMAMAMADRPPLSGRVELGLIPFRWSRPRDWDRGLRDPVAVAALAQDRRVIYRFCHIHIDTDHNALGDFVRAMIAERSVVVTGLSNIYALIEWGERTHSAQYFVARYPPLVIEAMPVLYGHARNPGGAAIMNSSIPLYLAAAEYVANRQHLPTVKGLVELLGLALRTMPPHEAIH